jgi:hypothetical protein
MSVEKILSEKAEEIKQEMLEEINRAAKFAEERYKAFAEQLQKAAKVALPVNILDILAKGGAVFVKEYDNNYEDPTPLTVLARGNRITDWDEEPTIKKGKYRIILIAEKIAETSSSTFS